MWKNGLTRYFSFRQFHEPGGYLEIWRIGWPLILLNASNTIMMITNRIFLARNSPEEIAAAMPTSQLFFTMMAFFLVTTGFTATVVAQSHGSRDRAGCVRATWNGFYFGVMVAALLAVALPVAGRWIFLHNGHDPRIAGYELEYFTGMSACAGFTCMETAFLCFFTGRGKTQVVAFIKGFGCLLCIPLNYLLIFGAAGLPALGILGAGIANSMANFVTMLMAFCFFFFTPQREYPTRSCREMKWEYIRKLLFFGTPAGLQTFIRNVAFAIVVMMIGHIGNEPLAATSIALSVNMIGTMHMIGLLDATSIATGQYIGSGRLLVAERIAGRSFRMFLLWLILPSFFYIFCPELLIHLFSSNQSGVTGMRFDVIASQVKVILLMAVFFNIMDGLRFITLGSLRGAGDTKVTLCIGLATSWLLQIPGTILLIYVFNASVTAVWAFLSFYIAVDAFFMLLRRRSGAWKTIRVIDLPAPQTETAADCVAATEARVRL